MGIYQIAEAVGELADKLAEHIGSNEDDATYGGIVDELLHIETRLKGKA
ncbi:hypothetical protein [Gordonia sihwensis]